MVGVLIAHIVKDNVGVLKLVPQGCVQRIDGQIVEV